MWTVEQLMWRRRKINRVDATPSDKDHYQSLRGFPLSIQKIHADSRVSVPLPTPIEFNISAECNHERVHQGFTYFRVELDKPLHFPPWFQTQRVNVIVLEHHLLEEQNQHKVHTKLLVTQPPTAHSTMSIPMWKYTNWRFYVNINPPSITPHPPIHTHKSW